MPTQLRPDSSGRRLARGMSCWHWPGARLRRVYDLCVNQACLDDLLQRVAARAVQQAEEEERSLRPPVAAADLDWAEEQLGFRLHPLLRRLYSEIADGGFGWEGSFLPLARAVSETVAKVGQGVQDPAAGQRRCWPLEALAVLDWGCGMNAVVDCRSLEGTVLLVDPNPGLPDRAGEWFLDAESLEAWLESWLTGINWYTPDGDDLFSVEPGPWPDAAARLSERLPPGPRPENRHFK
jgi:SMI1 / KNR4 family (SUKH-1)